MLRKSDVLVRLQLHGEHAHGKMVTLDDARQLMSLLNPLGVTGLYLSSVYESTTPDGYHLRYPLTLNTDLGGRKAFNQLLSLLGPMNAALVLDTMHHFVDAPDEIVDPIRSYLNLGEMWRARLEDPEILEQVMPLVIELLQQAEKAGVATGLRLDFAIGCPAAQEHNDGQAPPLVSLFKKQTPASTIIYEHTPAPGELLPPKVDGDTGQRFNADISGLLIRGSGQRDLETLYQRFTGQTADFAAVSAQAAQEQLDPFDGEITNVLQFLQHTDSQYGRDELEQVLLGKEELPSHLATVENFRQVHLTKIAIATKAWIVAGCRCYSNPALNEGGSPTAIAVQRYQSLMSWRAEHYPLAFADTFTHDFRVSGDTASFLIAALTWLVDDFEQMLLAVEPIIWEEIVELCAVRRADAWNEKAGGISRVDVWNLLVTIIGSPTIPIDRLINFTRDKTAYRVVEKLLREGGQRSNWNWEAKGWRTDYEYEARVRNLLLTLYDSHAFLSIFRPFLKKVANVGRRIALVKQFAKLTSPQVAVLYQLDFLWGFFHEDPDNRQDLDLGDLETEIQRLAQNPEPTVADFILEFGTRDNTKLGLTLELLAVRREFAAAWEGPYIPIETAPTGWCGHRLGKLPDQIEAYFCFDPRYLDQGPQPQASQEDRVFRYNQFGLRLFVPKSS